MQNWAFDLGSFLAGLVGGGVISSFLTFSITKPMRSDRGGTTTDQSRAKAGGDIVGRDKKH